MCATIENTELVKYAAAGLGRKARSVETVIDGAGVGVAWSERARVEVWAGAPGVYAADEHTRRVVAMANLGGSALRRILAVSAACDVESSRYALGGTLAEIAEGATLAVIATDGKRMHIGHLQPSAISGQASPIVKVEQWQALGAAVRASVRGMLGRGGRRIDATIDAGSLVLVVRAWPETGGDVVEATWLSACGGVAVRSVAPAIQGRFPRWRDVVPDMAIEPMAIDAAAVAAAAAECRAVHRTAERAARAAYMAEPVARGGRARKPGRYVHPRGVIVSTTGMVGRGCEWTSAVPVTAVPVCIDPAYLVEALEGAAAWGGDVVTQCADDISPVTVSTSAEFGPRFVAVLMPMDVR